MWAWTKRIAKWCGLGLLGLLFAGAVFQQVAGIYDRHAFPAPGKIVEVEGHMVHVLCVGSGETTFVLDAGLGAWSFEWFRIQPALAKAGRVCAVDRPGLGWSERWGDAYDASRAADLMTKIVDAAGIKKPFIYVGHSLGANFGIVYAAKYPKNVSAIVLLEPGDPKDLLEDFRGNRADALAVSTCSWTCLLGRTASFFGIPRVVTSVVTMGVHSFAGHPEIRDNYTRGLSTDWAPATIATLFDFVPATAFEDRDVKTFGDIPVLVLTSSRPREPDSGESEHDLAVWRGGELKYFASLVAMSTHGKGPVTIPNSNHGTMTLGPAGETTAREIIAFARENGLEP
jgi:pimeloyl-ACP methyl ester carboxylesterase